MVKRTTVDKPTVKGGTLHPIYAYNDNYICEYVQETPFKSIAAEVHISARKLAKIRTR